MYLTHVSHTSTSLLILWCRTVVNEGAQTVQEAANILLIELDMHQIEYESTGAVRASQRKSMPQVTQRLWRPDVTRRHP